MDWTTLRPFFDRMYGDSPDGIWFASPDLDRVHYANDAFERLVGVSRETVYDDPLAYLSNVHPEDRADHRRWRRRLADVATASASTATGTDTGTESAISLPESTHEFRVSSDSGSPRWLAERVFPVRDPSGTVQCWAAIVRDVTGYRDQIDVLEVQTEQLEVLNQVIRHDIRNEVNLGAELLRTIDTETEQDRERLDQVAEILDRVADLTETARDMTEVITTLSSDPEPVSLTRTLNREIASAGTVSDDATIEINGEIPDVEVQANEIVSAVFRNVLTNAIQHNDTDHPRVTVVVSLSEAAVTVHVADNGPGIPDSKKEAIFETGKTLASSGGTGFGLALAETLVEQYGGAIYVWDNEPEGSVLSITLPRANAGSSGTGSDAPTESNDATGAGLDDA